MDCCYSGAIGGLFAKGDELNLSELAQARGFVVLTSSTQFQESFEAPAENNSLFTKFLLDGIETGNADTNNDGIITVDEAFTYAANLARGLAVQTPTKFGIDVRGDMFLAKNRNFAPIPKIDFSQIPPTEMVKYVVVDQMVNALQRGDEVGYFVALVGYWIEGIPYPASGLTVNVTSTMNPRLTEQAFEGDVFFSPNMLYPITVEKNGVVKKEFNGNETDVVRVRVRVYFKDIIVISLYHQEQQIDLVQDSAAASRLITFHQMQQSFLEQWTATNSLPNEREFYKLV